MRGAVVVVVVVGLGFFSACGRLGFDPGTDVTGDGPRAGDGPHTGDAVEQGDGAGSATLTLVQSSVASVGTASQTVTLPSPTAAGTLLVATLGVNNISGVSAPPGWQINANGSVSGGCVSAMATDTSGTAGRQTFAFTLPAGAPVALQITEWSGIALGNPFDGAGFGGGATPTTALTISTLTADTTAGDLAIATFCQDTTMPAFTRGAGWLQLGQVANVASSPSLVAEFRTGVPAQQITATATSSLSSKFAGVILTFHVP